MRIRKAYAVEANPLVFNRFKFKNSNVKNLKYLNLAILDHNKVEILGVPNNFKSDRSSVASFKNLNPKRQLLFPVKCVTLDHLAKKFRMRKNFAIWVDIEGVNYRLLKGALDSLIRVQVIYMEILDGGEEEESFASISSFLSKFKFEPVLRDCVGSRSFNVIFVKSTLKSILLPIIQNYERELRSLKLPLVFLPHIKIYIQHLLSYVKYLILKNRNEYTRLFIHKILALIGSQSSREFMKSIIKK